MPHCWLLPSNLAIAVVVFTGALGGVARAQAPAKTVADHVYTDEQADRGAAAYDNACSGCHRADLNGGNGPALRGERFARIFAGKDLKTFYTKVATTMPRGAPASLGDNVYLDIVAHVLRENGFPAGPKDLSADVLPAINVLPGRPKPPPPVGDFSYVEVVGCLLPGPDNTWLLSRASEPVGVLPTGSAGAAKSDAAAKPLGSHEFRLLDAMAYNPQSHKGEKMYVRGLLIRLPGENRMTISSIESIAPTCQ